MHWRFVGPLRGGRTTSIAGAPGHPNLFYIGVVNGGVWKTDDAGRTWSPIFDSQPTGRSAHSRSRRAIRTSSTPAAAKDCSAPISRSATASTNRPTPARRGRISACATVSRFRRSRSIRRMPTALVRRGARPSVRTQRRARRLPFARRRGDVRARALQERKRRCVRRRARSARFERRLCDAVGGAPSAVGDRRLVRNSRQRHLQIDRRRNDVVAVDERTPARDRARRDRGRAEQSARSSTRTPTRRSNGGAVYRSDDAGAHFAKTNGDAANRPARRRSRVDRGRSARR